MAHIRIAVLALNINDALGHLGKYCRKIIITMDSESCVSTFNITKDTIWDECIYKDSITKDGTFSADAFISFDGELVSVELMQWYSPSEHINYERYLITQIIREFEKYKLHDVAYWFIFSCHI